MQTDGRTVYSCIASNEAGNAEQRYRINILGRIKRVFLFVCLMENVLSSSNDSIDFYLTDSNTDCGELFYFRMQC